MDITQSIITKAGLLPHEDRYYPKSKKKTKPRVYPYVRNHVTNGFLVSLLGGKSGSLTIKLYNLENDKRKLEATWSGLSRQECDAKFALTIDTIHEVTKV
ncbi:MAG: hypothetical protein ACXABY_03555 [Candidatus Thorarchaeota archaeon]|jgi:hypothetical protein